MWKKAKVALGLDLCAFEPKTLDEEDKPVSSSASADTSVGASEPLSAASYLSCIGGGSGKENQLRKTIMSIPTFSDPGISNSASTDYTKTCAICLGNMKAGHGAIFTAECSHAFHFNCIASNVKHGNRLCPVCRAKWKEIPFLGSPSSELPHGRGRVNPIIWPQDDGSITLLRRIPRSNSSVSQQHHLASLFNISEPSVYDDDESVGLLLAEATKDFEPRLKGVVDVMAYPEFSSVPKMASEKSFSILLHLKAPCAVAMSNCFENQNSNLTAPQPSRTPADLVTLLDVSGSMAGTKLALLKRAMSFVIQNLGPSDRLSVVAFSSTAHRLFPLYRMTESGRQQALQAVNSLISSGGTNIAEGLRKGMKVVEERKEKNPVCSIILLSDGQDTYTVSSRVGAANRLPADYQSLLPPSIRGNAGHHIPVHTFGFGADHDSVSMHSISEASGGTFSFIESESAIQDAFAQCIGGLLSVVVQELTIEVECLHPDIRLAPIKSGSYPSQVMDGVKGSISVGDLYADEERDFLVSVSIPPVTDEETDVLKVGCSYKDPLSKEEVNLVCECVKIQRPDLVAERGMSIEVDRERNRVRAAEAMAEAKAAAERGSHAEALLILQTRRMVLEESLAGKSGDQLCASLDAELRECQARMESRQRYEDSGRAYVLSGLSSHSWQRATARGNSTESSSLVHAYQTPSMVDMLQRSQVLSQSQKNPKPPVRPTKSFPSRPNLK